MKLKSLCNASGEIGSKRCTFIRNLTIMQLIIIISVIFIQPLRAGINTQTVTLSFEKVSLKTIFKEINRQTGYEFIYNSQMLEKAHPVSIKLEKVTIIEALDACFKEQPFSYVIEGKTIVVTPKSKQIQEITISGKICDKNGTPLTGANIQIKGTTKGTTSDLSGNYSIKAPENAILVIGFIGYKKLEIYVAGNTRLNITMIEEAAELQEIAFISTGYQKIKPEQSTGSLTTIKAKEFDTRVNTTDFLIGLQNKVPGLLINNDIQFEGNSLFQIRGISTINGDRQPLIVIDGFPTELSLNMINPNEIESVTVLKDAAAATVYGVRASNGVIIIERKKAQIGKPMVNFRTTFGFTPKENYDRYRWDKDGSNTTIDYSKIVHKTFTSAYWDLAKNPTFGSSFAYSNYTTPDFIRMRQAAGVITSDEANRELVALGSYNNTKDYGKLFLRTAVTQTYNMDISGGTDNALYYFTANYYNNDLSNIRDNNNQFKLTGRSSIKFSNRLSMDLAMDFKNRTETSVPLPDINSVYPYEHFQDGDGNALPIQYKSHANPYYNEAIQSLGLLDNMYYPLQDINEIKNHTNVSSNSITANFHYKIGDGININFGGIYEKSSSDTKHLASESSSEARQYINYYTQINNGELVYNIPKGSVLKQSKTSTKSYTLRAQLNYDKQLNDEHSINLILGSEVRDVLNNSNSATYFGYNDQTLQSQPVNYTMLTTYRPSFAANNSSIYYSSLFGQLYSENRYVSAYSNIVYAYKGKYSVTGSIRVDQSNLFGTDPKYRYKPLWSIGAAWNIHKEKFMQSLDIVKSLKLRMAYGFNGNVAKNVLPQVIAQYSTRNVIPSETIETLKLLSFANSGLRWEQTNNFNIGLDFSLSKKLSGNIDYYIKKSKDVLANNQIDASKGGSYAIVNQASIRNSGFELNITADWITHKNFNWNTGFVFSHNKSTVINVYNSNLTSTSAASYYVNGSYANYVKGYPIGAIFNYRYAGLNSTNGNILIYDKDGVAKSNLYSTNKSDVDYVGSSIPSISIGLSNRFDIGNFYLYCMANFYGGFKVRVPVPNPSSIRPLKGATNYWKQTGDETNPDVLPNPSNLYSYTVLGYTDKYTVNGAYLTIGDITAAYSFRNSRLVKAAKINSFEIRVQASNIYTVAFNKYNYSMATSSYAKSYITPTYTVGLYINF